MGCASSKQKRCRHCNAPYSPESRTYTVHAHHPPQSEGDSYHVVALTSTTLGSLKLDLSRKVAENGDQNGFKFSNGKVSDSDGFNFSNGNLIEDEKSEALNRENKAKEFSMGLTEAKAWSNRIDQKIPQVIPKTPTRTPLGEPETINTWELMEGLEDTSPFRSPNHFRSFSFDVLRHPVPVDQPKSNLTGNVTASPKPMWSQMTQDDSNIKSTISDFDLEVVSSFSKSLQELSPDSSYQLRSVDNEKHRGKARKDFSFNVTEEKKMNDDVIDFKPLPGGNDKVVLYFTSIRGVRKTYEDCCHVRVILKGLGVRVDERDVSMHSGFKEELKEQLGDGFTGGGLPRVFLGNNYIGGVEEIQKLQEDGQLEKLLNCCEKINDGGGVCEACGDIRFLPCETCSGSCKIYYEGHEEEGEDGEVGEYGFQRCSDCNENGLIRCPMCC